MLSTQNYTVLAVISSSTRTIVYQAVQELDKIPVILKTSPVDYPSKMDIARLKYEYHIIHNLNLPGVVTAYALDESQGKPILVLEDFGGRDLAYWLRTSSLSISQILSIGQQLANTLGQLHDRRIIHKDIKPENIIFNPENNQLKLTDFSISSLLSKENPTVSSPNLLEGTLAYISPEQTGRMNRVVDYRSDFYSLGVTLYELLTGQLPFQAEDPMALVHCHIAKAPQPPHEINRVIPPILSEIILKLMAKTAEDRYQGAYGIQADLALCLAQWQSNQTITHFPLAQEDQRGTFSIPQKLYGREAEVQQLLEAFDRINTGTTEMILVAGYSGIGKSALVNEVHKPIARQRGYFIHGKFDQFQRNIPYASAIQAFRELVRQLLTETEAQIGVWRDKLTNALGKNGQVIVDVIPEVESIIGLQIDVPSLPASEAQNRFNLVFRAFIHVFTQKEHPLVIFLDDLQWADTASLQLIEQLMTDPDGQYLLLLGAYRDNEVDAVHPLMRSLRELTTKGTNLQTITLKPLDINHVCNLVRDTLYLEATKVEFLAQLLINKTQGNPFFLIQLFKYLYTEQVISFNRSSGEWEFNTSDLLAVDFTENVVDLMILEIQKLDPTTQNVLQLAACVGNQFDLRVLAIVNEKTATDTAAELWNALQAGLVVPLSDTYKISSVVQDWTNLPITYKFLHDRVQQAAYSLISDQNKQEVHLKVGRLLWQSLAPDQLDDRIFDIVNPLNIGADLITDPEERLSLAELNFRAGSKAKVSAAYASAHEYFLTGQNLLPETAWENQYDLTLKLSTELVEVEYLLTRFDSAQALSDNILSHVKTPLDSIKIYELKIQFFIAQVEMNEAITTALFVLDLLGYPLQIDPNLLQLVRPLPKVSDLNSFPEMVDRPPLAALQILIIITGPAYQARPDLLPFIVFKMVNLCLEFGHSSFAAYAYGMYGLMLCGPLNQIELGYQSGQISLQILKQYPSDALKCKIYMLFNSFVGHWKEPHYLTISALEETVYLGLETGDMVYAAYCTMWSCGNMMLVGIPLAEVAIQQQAYVDLLSKIKQEHAWYPAITWRQLTEDLVTENLGAISPDARYLKGKYLHQELVDYIHASQNQMFLFFVCFSEVIFAYLMKDWETARKKIAITSEYQPAATASMLSGGSVFYETLVRLITHKSLPDADRSANDQSIESLTEKIANFASHAPENYQSKHELILAERARLQGETLVAMDYYDRAIATAQSYGFLAEVGIASERAAEFYESLGREKIANQYRVEALQAYGFWGATAKVSALKTEYSFLQKLLSPTTLGQGFGQILGPSISQSASTRITTAGGKSLDYNTIIKATQALSGEIFLDRLLASLTHLALENAGAELAHFLLKEQGQLIIAASEHINGKVDGQSILNQPCNDASFLPISVIQYVQRSQEAVMLVHAAAEGLFINDPYIIKHQTQSLLCVPILQKGEFLGILYLENNLTIGAFTHDRLEILNILTGQAAISIENARLYQNLEDYSNNLEQKVADRTKELEEKNISLQATLQELQQTQAQLIQSEKMSGLGKMVAGIAHEINNPVTFIKGNINHARHYFHDLIDLVTAYQSLTPQPPREIEKKLGEIEFEFLCRDFDNVLTSMTTGSDRISQIVLSLRNFSRLDESARKSANIHEGLDNTILIVQHCLMLQGSKAPIILEKNYGNLPSVNCYPSMLNQVFLNILTNAIDALNSDSKFISAGALQPKIYITTEIITEIITEKIKAKTEGETKTSSIQIRITDNGPGMSETVRPKIFDPFFTTKPIGQGKGLGLSVSYQIITEQHGGQLRCFSKVDQGTEFVIDLPLS